MVWRQLSKDKWSLKRNTPWANRPKIFRICLSLQFLFEYLPCLECVCVCVFSICFLPVLFWKHLFYLIWHWILKTNVWYLQLYICQGVHINTKFLFEKCLWKQLLHTRLRLGWSQNCSKCKGYSQLDRHGCILLFKSHIYI